MGRFSRAKWFCLRKNATPPDRTLPALLVAPQSTAPMGLRLAELSGTGDQWGEWLCLGAPFCAEGFFGRQGDPVCTRGWLLTCLQLLLILLAFTCGSSLQGEGWLWGEEVSDPEATSWGWGQEQEEKPPALPSHCVPLSMADVSMASQARCVLLAQLVLAAGCGT